MLHVDEFANAGELTRIGPPDRCGVSRGATGHTLGAAGGIVGACVGGLLGGLVDTAMPAWKTIYERR